MDAFWAAPPVMRTLVAATVLTSASVYGGLLSYQRILFYAPWVYNKFPPEIWRLATSFWLTGPQLGMLFDPYMLWTYGSQLETDSPRFARKGDFFTFAAFVMGLILILDGVFLGGVSFLQALILAFAYVYGQDNSGRQVSFFIVTFSARYLPFAMLAMTFVMAGPPACMHQATGLLAAHMYDFLTRIWPAFGGGPNLVQTPRYVSEWFGEGEGSRTATTRGYGTAFQGGAQPVGRTGAGATNGAAGAAGAGQSGSWTSGFSNWGSRGTGRRLGGD